MLERERVFTIPECMVVLSFQDWERVLKASESLGRLEKRRYQITIRWYLSRLKQEGLPATVKTARWFVEEAEERRNPSAATAQELRVLLGLF